MAKLLVFLGKEQSGDHHSDSTVDFKDSLCERMGGVCMF